jgi:predicted TIM-barrel fold metal-dependent hydrolase
MQTHDAAAAPSYEGPIFDGDTHIYEQADSWSRYLPKEYRQDWGYHWKKGEDGEYALYVGSRKVEVSAGFFTEDGKVPPPGKMHEWLRAMKEGKLELDMRVEMTRDMTHAAERLAKMDEFGVEACFLYCGNMVSSISYLDQVEPAKAVLHAYNQWMYDEWKFNLDDRIYSAPLISLIDLDWACQEAEWAIKKGTRLFLMPMGPFNGKAPADPAYDRFWSILNEAHCRVVYHVSEAIFMKDHMAVWGERMQSSRLRQTAFMWMNGYGERPLIETLSSYVFYNFFARFPNLKILSAENGSEWVPNMLVKMDKCRGMAKLGHWPGGQLKERPSSIFKRHIGVVAYPEDDIKSIVDQVGDDNWIINGSDYPHSEGVEKPRDFVAEACAGLTPEQVRKVMYDNGKRFIARI